MSTIHYLATNVSVDIVPPFWRLATKFGYFLGLAAVTGSTTVHALVLRPALRDPSVDPADREVLARRSARIMAWAGVVLLAALYPQLAGKATRASKTLTFGQGLHPSQIWAYVTDPGPGGVWVSPATLILITYILFTAVALLLVLLFVPALRDRVTGVAVVASPLIIVSQLITAIPGNTEGWSADYWAMTAAGYLHPIAGPTWLGGLATLAFLAGARNRLTAGSGLVWAGMWRRFSILAEVCVGTVLVTGLWLGWKEVGGFDQLWGTWFGRTLILKVTLVLTLICLGAFNELVLFPRMARHRVAGDTRSVFKVAVEHLPRVVAIEALIGLAVLVVVPFLNGSAREQSGGTAEPPATAGIFTAVLILLATVVVAFFVSLRIHEHIDNPKTAATQSA